MPIASTMPNRVDKLTLKPSAAMPAKAPMIVTGTVVAGTSVARKVLQKDEDHDEDQNAGLP